MRTAIFKCVFPILLMACMPLGAQVRITSEDELRLLKELPMEAIYVHSNASLFLPGEYLYFSLYCINTKTFRSSGLSKVAYVQLIGENGMVAFTHKVPLDRGMGQGDYFFPTDLPSGNYKLVAYTHWMKNAGKEQFFMADITFLNPYRADQTAFLTAAPDSVICGSGNTERGDMGIPDDSGDVLALELEGSSFRPGEEVTLGIRNYRDALGHGRYSLSVRRVEEFPHARGVTSRAYASGYPDMKKEIPQRVNDQIAVPEQRGELISGQVRDLASGEPLAGQWLAISLPGEDFQFKQAQTDREGKFYTYITLPFQGEYGIAELMESVEVPPGFTWARTYQWEGDIPCFHSFRLDASMEEAIRQRSVHNQIENSYFEVKPDTILQVESPDPFQGDVPLVFELDEFTRFPTLRETFVEVVNFVMVRRDDEGGSTFRVLPPLDQKVDEDALDPPLVVMDGILVPQIGALLDYDARKIRNIKVLRGQYQLGGMTYQGMVAIETMDAVYASEWESDLGERFSYLPPRPHKQYYRQGPPSAHIPDFRYQLLWEPDIRVEGAGKAFSFYTSQVPGTYEVRLEGFTSYGKPVSLRAELEVGSQ